MSVKGGYHILNLQNKDLQYAPTIPGAYESVEGSYQKPILLSGIVIGGVEKADVYRMPVVSGSSYVFENVYGYDLTLTDSDGLSLASTQWATRNYVDGKAQMENIVDGDGHKRFVEGDSTGTQASGVTISYGKWSLSGSHLMLVAAGTIADATTVNNGDFYISFQLPTWIYDKIYPVWESIYIERKGGLLINPALGSDTQDVQLILQKENSYISFRSYGSVTTTSEKAFRFQFDLLIDAE